MTKEFLNYVMRFVSSSKRWRLVVSLFKVRQRHCMAWLLSLNSFTVNLLCMSRGGRTDLIELRPKKETKWKYLTFKSSIYSPVFKTKFIWTQHCNSASTFEMSPRVHLQIKAIQFLINKAIPHSTQLLSYSKAGNINTAKCLLNSLKKKRQSYRLV